MNKKNSNSGFTLVELAIVLVIIGLIVGGVLVGQDLIKAATIRAGVTQLEQYDTATNTFRGKYNGLPGDLSNQTQYFPSVTNTGGTGSGDNNGQIDSISAAGVTCTASTCISGEAAIFWYELNQAGLIAQVITTTNATNVTLVPGDAVIPASKLGKGSRVGVQALNGRNYYVLANYGTTAAAAGKPTFTAGMSPSDAMQLDTKMDDAQPGSGKVLSIDLTSALPGTPANINTTAGAASTTNCGVTPTGATTASYNAATSQTGGVGDTMLCSLSIRTSF